MYWNTKNYSRLSLGSKKTREVKPPKTHQITEEFKSNWTILGTVARSSISIKLLVWSFILTLVYPVRELINNILKFNQQTLFGISSSPISLRKISYKILWFLGFRASGSTLNPTEFTLNSWNDFYSNNKSTVFSSEPSRADKWMFFDH